MEKYKRIRVLGQGARSKVFLVHDEETGEECVVKQLEAALSGQERDAALREAALLRALRHPHIVGYREAFVTRSGHICLIMEYAEGGDLQQFLQEHRHREGAALPELLVLRWAVQLCSALEYLHGRNVLHRDIKSHNIFLRKDSKLQFGDFGISTVLRSNEDCVSSAIGTPCYASPERVRRRPYGASADIWSLGVVFYELCALRRPFVGETLAELADRILVCQYEPLDEHCFSQDLREAVYRMLAPEPEERPTAAEILVLPLFSEAHLLDPVVEDLERTQEPQLVVESPTPEPPEPRGHICGGAPRLPPLAAELGAGGRRDAGGFGECPDTQGMEVEVLDDEDTSFLSEDPHRCPMTAWVEDSRVRSTCQQPEPPARTDKVSDLDSSSAQDVEHWQGHGGLGQALLHGARRMLGLGGKHQH